jgi:hypothetical protein
VPGGGGLLCLVNVLGRKGQLEVPDRSGPDRAETRPRGYFPSFPVLGREAFLTPVEWVGGTTAGSWPGWTHEAHHRDNEVAVAEAAVFTLRAVVPGVRAGGPCPVPEP